jgi:hypothetical protein
MLRHRMLFAFLLLPMVSISACGGSDDAGSADSERTDRGPANVLEAVDAARAAAQAMSENSERRSPPLDPEELRDRMPETVAGLPRVDLTVASGSMGGVAGTTVHARYQNDERDYVEITLVDLSATPGMAAASAAWSTMTFDRTTPNGFERTARFEGFPAMESEVRRGRRPAIGAERARRHLHPPPGGPTSGPRDPARGRQSDATGRARALRRGSGRATAFVEIPRLDGPWRPVALALAAIACLTLPRFGLPSGTSPTDDLANASCRCAERPLAEYYAEADQVHVGQVIAIHPAGDEVRIDVALLEGSWKIQPQGGQVPRAGDTLSFVTSASSASCGLDPPTGAVVALFRRRSTAPTPFPASTAATGPGSSGTPSGPPSTVLSTSRLASSPRSSPR